MQQATAQPAQSGAGVLGVSPPGNAIPTPPEPADLIAPQPSKAHYLWAVLIARIYEVFPLPCPLCGGQMRIIAFITRSADIRQILDQHGVQTEPPNMAPARGRPLWDDHDEAQAGQGAQGEPDWDLVGQPAPDYEVDRQVNW